MCHRNLLNVHLRMQGKVIGKRRSLRGMRGARSWKRSAGRDLWWLLMAEATKQRGSRRS